MRSGSFMQVVIVALLAVVTPLCCCQMRGVWGSGGCCVRSAEGVSGVPTDAASLFRCAVGEGKACCHGGSAADQGGEDQKDPVPVKGCGKKSCCVKGFTPAPHWSPDVDVVGSPVVMVGNGATASMSAEFEHRAAMAARDGPPERAVMAAGMSLVRLRCALLV